VLVQTLEFDPAVADATAKVLEFMCFTSILDEAVELEDSESSWVAAKLAFAGKPSGSLGVGVSRASACSIAANFLGLDTEELSPTQINEVIGELTNIIAGSLVSSFKSDCCFALSHPEMESPDEFIEQLKVSKSRIFRLEDGFFAVWLQIHE
jgi:CheY-specific phosphatase CheX